MKAKDPREPLTDELHRRVQFQSSVQRSLEREDSPQERLRVFWALLQQQARWDAQRGIDAVQRWREEQARAPRA